MILLHGSIESGQFLLWGETSRQGLTGHALSEGEGARRTVVAGHEPPQNAVLDDGDRGGGRHIHVAQILKVDRRDAAQFDVAQIEL